MKIKPEIKEEIRKFIREKLQQRQQEVTVVAPYKLSSEELAEIVDQFPDLKDKQVKTAIDSRLIAGVVIKLGTKVLDLSLAQRIRNLQHLVNESA